MQEGLRDVVWAQKQRLGQRLLLPLRKAFCWLQGPLVQESRNLPGTGRREGPGKAAWDPDFLWTAVPSVRQAENGPGSN